MSPPLAVRSTKKKSKSNRDSHFRPRQGVGMSTTDPRNPPVTVGAVGYPGPGPELILFVRDPASIDAGAAPRRASIRGGRSHNAPPAFGTQSPLSRLLAEESADAEPLFDDDGLTPTAEPPSASSAVDRAAAVERADAGPVIDLRTIFRINAPPDRLEHLLKRLSEEETVDGVFIKPQAEPAAAGVNAMAASAAAPPQRSPDFTPMQGYLDAAPGGISARFAWTQAGGRGAGVRIIDVEGEWRYTHESLVAKINPTLLGGTLPNSLDWRNHGTAVAGVIIGAGKGTGITGICPDAKLSTVSSSGSPPWGSAKAIRRAASKLRPGDILLLELHRPGPRFNFTSRPLDQKGYIAIEWWPDDFAAIRYATAKGMIVVGAAGNGAEDLDDALYNNGPIRGRFPGWWVNPFARQKLDSGAILAGAGAPPSGAYGADRSRLDFSNYGACVDCQGWGREVTSSGYGDLQGGNNEDRWYTSQFGGTSSASPVVVGALGCAQGALRAAKKAPLMPLAARNLLRNSGSAQQPEPGRPVTQRIGPRPNLATLIPAILATQPTAAMRRKTGTPKKSRPTKPMPGPARPGRPHRGRSG